MAIDYELNSDGMVVAVLVAGKAIMRSKLNALLKAQATPFWHLRTTNAIRQNPFSGVKVELTPFEASVYDWCIEWYRRYNAGQMPTPVSVFDNMRYLFMELNTNAYYDLLD